MQGLPKRIEKKVEDKCKNLDEGYLRLCEEVIRTSLDIEAGTSKMTATRS